MNKLEQKIVDSTENATFFEVLYEEYRKHIDNDDNELVHTLVYLHNQKRINLLSEFSLLNNEISSSEFFRIQNILRNLLPSIIAPVEDVKKCVKQLALAAPGNTSSYELIEQFINFCSKDMYRVNDLLEQELITIDESFDHISTALIAGFGINRKVYFDKAIQLLSHKNLIIAQRALSAFSRFNFSNDPELVTLATKEIIFNTENTPQYEQLLPTVVYTLIILLSNYKELEVNVMDFLKSNITQENPDLLFKIAQQLNYRHNSLSEEIQKLLFKFFRNLDGKHIGIIENIDEYIYKRIPKTNAIAVSELFEYLLDNNDESFQINTLSLSLQTLQEKEYKEMLGFIFTKWLIKRESAYCISAFNLVKTTTADQIKIEFDKRQVKKEDLVYLAKKSIGWLSFQPSAALSLIISIIPMCSESEMQLIENKTFDFIALNYPSQTKAFLQEYSDSSERNIVKFSENLIQRLESFLEKFSKIYEIKELRPSTRQRNEYANYQQKIFDEVSSKPTESLFFTNLFTKKITLYGNKSIHKHKDSNGETIRQVIPFSKMSHSIDFPSLANLTPHTTQYFLYKFQFEELVNETNS